MVKNTNARKKRKGSERENNMIHRNSEEERERENLILSLFLFYNGYKLGRVPLFIWPFTINDRIIT